jgi:hypothetical protein
MGLRSKNKKWHYRFMVDGHNYTGGTGLAATKQNVSEATRIEANHRTALLEGHRPAVRVVVREFSSAVGEFWNGQR